LRKRGKRKKNIFFSAVASKPLKSSIQAVFAKILFKTFFHAGFTLFDELAENDAEPPAKT
jgi:hypothetical protein